MSIRQKMLWTLLLGVITVSPAIGLFLYKVPNLSFYTDDTYYKLVGVQVALTIGFVMALTMVWNKG